MQDADRAVLATVARMYYLDGLSQGEIADIVGVSRSTVSRQLTAARTHGVVRITVDDYDPRHPELEHALIRQFGLRRALVVRGLDGSTVHARKAVAYFSADIVGSWIGSATTIGVAGGRTLGLMTQFMEPQPTGTASAPEIVHLMGTVGAMPSSIDASEIARGLAQRLGGSVRAINAPAYMDDVQSRDLLIGHRQLRAVLERFATLDVALVGIGTPVDSLFAERQSFSKRDHAILNGCGAIGEICGRFFDTQGRECETPFRHRVIAIELDHLRRAGETIAITAGATKQTAVRAAIAGRLIDSLVIDEAGAAALLAGEPPAPVPNPPRPGPAVRRA